jgi:hypothetical protein
VPPLTPIVPVYGVPTVAAGGELNVSVVLGLIVIVIGPVDVFGGLLESVPCTVAVIVPGVVGVPVIEQFEFSVSPAGTLLPEANEHV